MIRANFPGCMLLGAMRGKSSGEELPRWDNFFRHNSSRLLIS
jgi:hypothetical protein